MLDHPIHCSPVERFNEPTIIFLTICTHDRKRILAEADVQEHLLAAWKEASLWQVGRYVLMPDHLHLFCSPVDASCSLGKWIKFWKSRSAQHWPRLSEEPVWQKDFWDTQLRRVEHYDQKWEYVRMNPVRAGLVAQPEQWPHQGTVHELRW